MTPPAGTATTTPSAGALVRRIRRGVIGDDEVVDGPYGHRRVVYADYTASGRALDFVEDFVRERVLPSYANTHTESSASGLQTSRLREDARRIIRDAVGGGEDDLVIFCGSGATAAVNKLVDLLDLRLPADPAARRRLRDALPPDRRPVVFVGPFEHHSNELPWRESIADVVPVGEDADGHIDLAELADHLAAHADRPLRIGSFSAASNVTGILSDTDAVAQLLHAHGALSLWDYAAAAPYVPIRVSESRPGAGDHKDAVFFSPHKFVGGPQTPGVLVVRRALVRDRVPTAPGGGTVSFVTPQEHRYLDDPVAREEGGTPAIVESVRAGLVVALKQAVGTEEIQAREERHWRHALRAWAGNPAIEILGNHEARRLSIVSFRIRYGTAHPQRHLHHNFVVTLLNDLFGVQARGGCSCAGPYGHRLLGIDPATSHALVDEIGRGWDGIKPGWIRVNFNYFVTDTVRDYLVEAVSLCATHGHRLLTDYRFDARTGLWRHRRRPTRPTLRLAGLTFDADGRLGPTSPRARAGEDVLAGQLALARALLTARPERLPDGPTGLPDAFERLRWFPLPPSCAQPERERGRSR